MQRVAVMAGVLLLAVAALIAVRVRENRTSIEDAEREARRAGLGFVAGVPSSEAQRRKSSGRQGSTVSAGPIYTGPNSLSEWLDPAWAEESPGLGNEKWRFHDGTLISGARGGAIAREIPLPETCRISFRVRWDEQFRFRILLFCDERKGQPDNCYDLVIQRRFAYLRKRWNTPETAGSRIIGQFAIGSYDKLIENPEALLEIVFYRKDGTVGLFVDGEREGVWIDQEPATGEFGDWVQFVAEESYPLEISEIAADAWDGVYPDTGERHTPPFEPDPERIAALTPPGGWAPAQELRQERERIRDDLRSALEGMVEGPERQAAQHAAIQANVAARQRYEEAFARLLEAKPVKDQPGFVTNPFTGERLNVRGVTPGSAVWDPRTGREDQIFRIP